ncbi:MAG: TIGR02281 family clan AA aspartic protease [Rhizobiaceae bacterium]
MKNIGALVFLVLAAAIFVPGLIGNSNVDESPATVSNARSTGPASVKAYRDSRGHFSFSTRMNGERVEVLVDTGATMVAINQSTAHRIGARVSRDTYQVSTANGLVDASSATIKEIRIGNVRVRNVKALVLSDQALSGTLLGMSFLKKLKRFEINGRTLTLTR